MTGVCTGCERVVYVLSAPFCHLFGHLSDGNGSYTGASLSGPEENKPHQHAPFDSPEAGIPPVSLWDTDPQQGRLFSPFGHKVDKCAIQGRTESVSDSEAVRGDGGRRVPCIA